MVWMLEGSGREAHHSPYFCDLLTHTYTPPPLPLIHSLTVADALLHSSLPGAVKKARETHKSKLKCSSECFLDMMHGSWDAARPCCYTCNHAETHRSKAASTLRQPQSYSVWNRAEIYDFIFFLAFVLDILKAVIHHHVRGLSGTRKWLGGGVIPVSVVSCHITLLLNWFLLSAFHQNINSWTLCFLSRKKKKELSAQWSLPLCLLSTCM